MLKGHVFNLQTFTAEAFAITFDKVLQGRCGVLKGCDLSNTSNSATIGEGFFVVRGRPLQVVGSESVSNITNNGYYSLVCEIDLSKTNTADTLNQAEIKIVYNASNYPTLTQQDITGSGAVYQYEFARFKVEGGSITDFTDKRTYLDFETLYDLAENQSQELINEIEEALSDVLDGSAYVLKSQSIEIQDTDLNNYTNEGRYFFPSGFTPLNKPADVVNGWLEVYTVNAEVDEPVVKQMFYRSGTINANDYHTYVRTRVGGIWSDWKRFATETEVKLKDDFAILTGTITLTNGNGSKVFNYPEGFTQDNCVPIAGGTKYSSSLNRIAFGSVQSSIYTGVYLNSSNIALNVDSYQSGVGPTGTFDCKVVLMKIS